MKNALGTNYDQFSLTITLPSLRFFLSCIIKKIFTQTQEMMRESLLGLLLHVFSCPSRLDISLSTYTLVKTSLYLSLGRALFVL